MVYVVGENESIQTLKKLESFDGSDQEYKNKLLLANPGLEKFIQQDRIKPNTLVLLHTTSSSPELAKFVSDINALICEKTKETLSLFQTNHLDIPTILSTHEIMEEAQKYSHGYRENINQAHVSIPWMNYLSTNKDLIVDALMTGIEGSAEIGAGLLYRTRHVLN